MDQNAALLAALLGGGTQLRPQLRMPQQLPNQLPQQPTNQPPNQLPQQPATNGVMDHPILRALASGTSIQPSQESGFGLPPLQEPEKAGGYDHYNVQMSVRDLVRQHFARIDPGNRNRNSGYSMNRGSGLGGFGSSGSSPFGKPDGRRGAMIRLRY